MNKLKRLIAVLTSLVVLGATATSFGCGEKVPDTDETLEIFVTNAGYGIDWLKSMVEAFKEEDWVKEKYPNLNIPDLQYDAVTIPAEKVVAGEKANSADLLISCQPGGSYYSSKGANGESLFEELSDVYNGAIPGDDYYDGSEGRTLRDKMSDGVYESQVVEQLDGTTAVYAVPWIRGTMGIFYNKTKLEEYMGEGYVMPRTTDELVNLTKTINDKLTTSGDAAFAFTANVAYWGQPTVLWWGQYEGVEKYENYFNGIDTDTGEYSVSALVQEGRLKALEVLESLVSRPNGFNYKTCTSDTYMELQTKFMKGTAGVFTVNGDWLLNEMKGVETDQTICMLKSPVVSAIVEKCTSVKNDEQLAFVVQCVDDNKEFEQAKTEYASKGYGSLTSADFERIYNARNMYTRLHGHEAFIPSYAKGKEVAKDFLRFMATDKGIEILMREGGGFVSPYKYEASEELFNGFSLMQQEHYTWSKTAIDLRSASSFRLYQYGGLNYWMKTPNLDTAMAAQNSDDRKSAQQIYDEDVSYWTANNGANFDLLLKKAGLK